MRVLEELDAEIYGLQEVDSRTGRGEPQVEFLARRMKCSAVPDPAIQHPGGYYGNILLTAFPIIQSTLVDISYRSQEPRSIIDSVLRVGESSIRVLVTHLGLASAERRHQIRRLLEVVCAEEQLPTVLLGDINEWLPFSPRLRAINKCLGDSPAPATFPARFPMLALDRIWVRPADAMVSLQINKNSLTGRASDHLPVVAQIRIGHRRTD